MDDRQKLAAAALAEGRTTGDVAQAVGRSERTVIRWVSDPEFQMAMVYGIRAAAFLALAQYLRPDGDARAGQAALATLRWLGAGKPKKPTRGQAGVEEEETDLGEFSEDSLRRLKGDG